MTFEPTGMESVFHHCGPVCNGMQSHSPSSYCQTEVCFVAVATMMVQPTITFQTTHIASEGRDQALFIRYGGERWCGCGVRRV